MSRAIDVVTLTGEEYDALIERIATMHEALHGIVTADWREWQELASAEEFVRWAKSRALHALMPNA